MNIYENGYNTKEVELCVYPEIGNAYTVTVSLADISEEAVDIWVGENLINVQKWEVRH